MDRITFFVFFLLISINISIGQNISPLRNVVIYEDEWKLNFFLKSKLVGGEQFIKYEIELDTSLTNKQENVEELEQYIENNEMAHLNTLRTPNKFVFQEDSLFGIQDINDSIIEHPHFNWFYKSSLGLFYAYDELQNSMNLFDRNMDKVNHDNYNVVFGFGYDENMCFVGFNDKFGVIDTSGETIIPLIYDNLKVIKDSFLVGTIGDISYLITKSNRILFTSRNKEIEQINYFNKDAGTENYCLFTQGMKKGLINFKGEVLFKPEFKNIKLLIFPEYSGPDIFISQRFEEESWEIYIDNKLIKKELYLWAPEIKYSNLVLNCSFLLYEENTNFGILSQNSGKLNFKKIESEGLKFIKKIALDDYRLSIGKYPSMNSDKIFSDLIYCKKKDKWGIIDKSGKFIIKPEYDDIYFFNKELFSYRQPVSYDYSPEMFLAKKNGKWGIIDILNNVIYDFNWDTIYLNIGDRFIKTESEYKYGLIDINGNRFLDEEFYEIERFSFNNGDLFAKVKNDEGWGLFNLDKEIDISQNPDLDALKNELLELSDDAFSVVLKMKGLQILPTEYDEINKYEFKSKKFIKAVKNNSVELYNPEGEPYDGSKYKELKEIGENLFGKNESGKWGIIYTSNNHKCDFKYDEIKVFSAYQSILLRDSSSYGLLSFNGNLLLDCIYDTIYEQFGTQFSVLLAKLGNETSGYKIINNDAQFLFKVNNLDIQSTFNIYESDLLFVKTSKEWLVYDYKSNTKKVFNDLILLGERTKSKNLFAYMDKSKWGLIKFNFPNNGRYLPIIDTIVICKYDMIYNFDSGINLLKVKINNRYGLIDNKGEKIVDFQYNYIEKAKLSFLFKHKVFMLLYSNGLWNIKEIIYKENKGNLSYEFADFGEMNYKEIVIKNSNLMSLIMVKKNQKFGLIDLEGNVVLDYIYDNIDFITEAFTMKNILKVKVNGYWSFVKFEQNNHSPKDGIKTLYSISQSPHFLFDEIFSSNDESNNKVFNYSNDKVIVKRNGKFGIVKVNLENLVEPEFDKIYPISRQSYTAFKDSLCFNISSGGLIKKISKDSIYRKESLRNGMYKQRKGCFVAFLNDKDRLTDFKYIDIGPAYDKGDGKNYPQDIAYINYFGKFGYINSKGSIIVEPKYDILKAFQEGYARVMIDGKWGFIDQKGKVVIDLKYDSVTPFKNGRSEITLEGKKNIIDRNGNIID